MTMKSKKLLMLGAGIEQIIAIKIAQGLGIQVIAADGNPRAPGFSIVQKSFALDIRDAGAVTRLAREQEADGIFCHAVEIPHVVAEASRRLGLPGLDPKAAYRATHKLSRYRCLAQNGVPCPRFASASSPSEALKRASDLGYPLVIKPVDNAGSRGVRKVESARDLTAAYHWAVQFSREQVVLLEAFVEGAEISTESVVWDGEIVTTGFADRNYEKKGAYSPYFIEDGHTIPSKLSAAKRREVVAVAERAIRALGIDWGVAKGDIILDAEGPRVLEMAARTSGGRFCSDMVPLATGVQILRPLIQMAVGNEVDIRDLKPRFSRGAAQRFFLPPPGRLLSVSGLDSARGAPGAYDVRLDGQVKPGFVVPPLVHHAARIGHAIASGADRAEAVANAERMVASVRFEIEPQGVAAT